MAGGVEGHRRPKLSWSSERVYRADSFPRDPRQRPPVTISTTAARAHPTPVTCQALRRSPG